MERHCEVNTRKKLEIIRELLGDDATVRILDKPMQRIEFYLQPNAKTLLNVESITIDGREV